MKTLPSSIARTRPASDPCTITVSSATADPLGLVTTGPTVGNTTLCATTGKGEPPGTAQPWSTRKALSAVTPSTACERTLVNAAAEDDSAAAITIEQVRRGRCGIPSQLTKR